MTAVGERIRARREYLGMSRADLSRAAEISATHVRNIEDGLKSPTIEVLGAVGRALGITFEIPPPPPVSVNGRRRRTPP